MSEPTLRDKFALMSTPNASEIAYAAGHKYRKGIVWLKPQVPFGSLEDWLASLSPARYSELIAQARYQIADNMMKYRGEDK